MKMMMMKIVVKIMIIRLQNYSQLRIEIARLILEQAGAHYKDTRVEGAQWPALKATLPLGQIPFLKDGEVQIPQSHAIHRYLARKYNLYGSNLVNKHKLMPW